jgi:putative SOS response-associated peptidase YedK
VCGRFTLTAPGEEIALAFGLEAAPSLAPRYNIAPTQEVAVVRRRGPGEPRSLDFLKWGLTPAPTSPKGRPALLINARAETADERPAFRDSFARRRCLVLADGFYEWSGTERTRRAFHIRLRSGRPFAFAGLWEPLASSPGAPGPAGACTILTTEPNELLRAIHDRMPVILPPDRYERWLDTEQRSPLALFDLVEPYPADAMTAVPVSARVNDPRNDDAECLRPLSAPTLLM